MTLLSVMIVLILIGVGLWMVNTYIDKMDPKIKTILNVVVVLVVVLWLLDIFGLADALNMPIIRR